MICRDRHHHRPLACGTGQLGFQEVGDFAAAFADQADDDDAEDDLVGDQQRLAVGDHVADAA